MRFSTLLALSGLAVSPAFATVQQILQAFSEVSNATEGLIQQLDNFKGPQDSLNILVAVTDVTSIVDQGTAAAKSTGLLSVNNAVMLVGPTSNLVTTVNQSITATINKKWELVNSGLGPETYRQLTKIKASSVAFSDAVLADVPASLLQTAQSIAAPINVILQNGVNAFAGTTIPNNVSYVVNAAPGVAAFSPLAAGAVLVAALAAF